MRRPPPKSQFPTELMLIRVRVQGAGLRFDTSGVPRWAGCIVYLVQWPTDGPLGPRQSPPPAKRELLSLRPPDTLMHILMPQGSHREGVHSIR